MTFHQLQIFVIVATRLNLRAAADELHIPQSSISHHLRLLQEDFWTQLYRKTRNGIELTRSGVLLLKEAKALLSRIDNLKTKFQSNISPSLRIGAPYTASTTFMPQLLAQFKRTHGNVKLTLRTDDGSVLTRMILKDDLDLAIIYGRPPYPRLAVEPFSRDPVIACVGREHPLAKKKFLTRKDASRFGLISRSPEGITMRFTDTFKKWGFKPKIVIRCDSSEAKRAALKNQMGFGLIFKGAVEHELKKGELVELRLPTNKRLYGNSYLVYKKKELSRTAQDFIKLLKDYRDKTYTHPKIRRLNSQSDARKKAPDASRA